MLLSAYNGNKKGRDLMPDLKDILNNDSAKKLMSDKGALERIQNAPETRRLLELLSQKSGSTTDQLANSASSGDSAQLMGAIQQLLRDPESQKLLGTISKNLPL